MMRVQGVFSFSITLVAVTFATQPEPVANTKLGDVQGRYAVPKLHLTFKCRVLRLIHALSCVNLRKGGSQV